MESKGIKYNSIWKHFNIQENYDMCEKCKKILLGEEDLQTLRKHLNLYHQIDVFDDVKFPACTIPYLHEHFQFGIMTTCNYCCKTESYLKFLDKLKIHFICFHKGIHLLTTETVHKILALSEVKCMDCFIIIYHLHRMHSLIRHSEVKHPEKLSCNETCNDKMNSKLTDSKIKQIITNSTLANLLKKEIEFRNKIQVNSQTDCESKQKTEEHSETLPTHHDKMNSKLTDSTLANLLKKEIEFQNKIQVNSQTDCESKQKTEEHSETLPTHHDKMNSKSTDSTLANLLKKEIEFQNKIQVNSQTDCESKQKTEEYSETLPTHHDKMNSKSTDSTLANLLKKEIEFRNKIQANSQTDCEIKQKTEGHSETLPTHHESALNISKSMDSNEWVIINSQGNEIKNEEKVNDPIGLTDTDWILL